MLNISIYTEKKILSYPECLNETHHFNSHE